VIRFALKGLAGRKLRASLTALAIVLGVAMISGSYVLTDTIDRAFNQIFTETYANTDAVVTGKKLGIESEGESADTPSIPSSLLETVRSVPEVEVASGAVLEDSAAKLLTKEGKAIDTHGAPSFAFGIDTSSSVKRFNPLNLTAGRWAAAPDEIVIDKGTAKDEGYAIGERIGLASLKPVREFTIVGIAQYGEVAELGSVTFAVLTIPVAQELFERKGQFDAISIAAKDGVTQDQLVSSLQKVLPEGAEAKSGVAQSEEDKDDISEFTTFIRYFLLAFGGIALFVGAFVIFNTLSITVAQRTREFATVRTIGASRRQVLGSVVLESLVIGFLASVIGLFLGLALAQGIQALFRSLNLDLPTTDSVFATRTVIVSLVVGTLITLLAGLAPAVRATRVPPIAAVREGAKLPRGRLARFSPVIAVLLTALAILLLVQSLFSDNIDVGQRLLSMAGGILLLFGGIAMLSSRIVRPLAAIVGLPAKRIGGAAGRLATQNARRNPGRTAATAAALMIGLALVTFVAVVAEGMRQSNRDAIESQVKADYVLTSQDGFTPFAAGAGDALIASPAVEATTSVRAELASVAGSDKYVTGIDPSSITRFYTFDWKEGSDSQLGLLGQNGAILDDDFADDKNLGLGDRFELLAPTGKRLQLEVKGIYKPPPFYPLLGYVSIPITTYDSMFERPRNQFSFVNVAGTPDDKVKAAIDEAVAGFPDAKVLTREEWIDDQEEDLNQFLTLLYVLLALSVIISLFGMVNTLVLSTFERTRELGMLRAVGMTRRQVRRMVRHESVITALIGAALGIPLGIFLAVLATEALSQYDLQLHVPVLSIVVFAVIAVLAGVAAAVLPARRAARLNVLQALQYE